MNDSPIKLQDMDLLTAGRELLADPTNPAARAQLEDQLRALAANLGEHELEHLLTEEASHPRRQALIDTLDHLAERTIVSAEGDGHEGVLLVVPFVLVSDKPIRDLPPAVVKKLISSLHQLGLLMRGESAALQRWINTGSGLLRNHVQRKRVLLGMMSESAVGRQPEPYRNTLPIELPSPGQNTEARFLTLSIQGPIGCLERIGLWGAPQMRPRLQAWMGAVAKAMKDQGYKVCSALPPCPYSMSINQGALLVAQELVGGFVEEAAATSGAPRAECTVHVRFSLAADRRCLSLTLRYLHEGAEVARQAVEVKELQGDDTIDVLVAMLSSHISHLVTNAGLRNAEFVHNDEALES